MNGRVCRFNLKRWNGVETGCFRLFAGLFSKGSRSDALQGGFDGLRVELPQESADVLDLPAPGPMTLYFTREFHGSDKLVRQPHGFKLAGLQGDQLFPQPLQGMVFLFFLSSAFILRIHLILSFGDTLGFFPWKNGLSKN
jgi:hypothetical protein